MRSTDKDAQRGEFLLMLLVAVAIVGVLAGILAPVLANKLDDAQVRSETEALRSLRKDFEATYDSTDFNNLNESSVASSGLPSGCTFTTFDQATGIASRVYGATISVDPYGWVTKLAQKRGVTSYSAGAVYSALTESQYTAIAFNPYGAQRCLVVGPTGEAGQQRYLLMSVMAPPYRSLGFPSANATQTFNSIWDQSWDAVDSQAPSLWASLLPAGQYLLWNTASANGRTNASRLIVERIVQPKYTLTLANNSATDTAWVDIGPAVNAIAAAPNSGTASSASVAGFTSGVLAGRLIVVRRGPAAASSYEVQRFFLYSDVNLTIQ
ncbi:MAG TPA: type II secretion system protein [Opitutaceae bacterium]|jgi:type II secretory pathway pseudopilin PulG|nr:type II secretion system protein [Opitutaceae bacterium]